MLIPVRSIQIYLSIPYWQIPLFPNADAPLVVIFGDPDNGEPVGSIPASKVLVICHTGDEICAHTDIVTPLHLSPLTPAIRQRQVRWCFDGGTIFEKLFRSGGIVRDGGKRVLLWHTSLIEA